MSSDRDRRARLEFVQTRLREIEPELAITETPGHAEKLAELQKQVREARHQMRESEERLTFTSGELNAARRAVSDMHLVVQAQQTNNIHPLLAVFLGPACVIGTLAGLIATLVYGKQFPEALGAMSVVSAFALGAVVRARVVGPPKSEGLGVALRVRVGTPPKSEGD